MGLFGVPWRIVFGVCTALYSVSLYQDRNKLRSFPFISRNSLFYDERFNHAEIPSMAGKFVVVTGANSGLGLESTKRMYGAGAHVVMGCRSLARCNAAKDASLSGGSGGGSLEVMELDLASFASVRRFADDYKQAHGDKLHVLMLNAGGVFPLELTGDGIETTFQVNHVSHHLLTRLLLPALEASAPSRVVAVSSDAHAYSYSEGIRGAPDLESINDMENTNTAFNYAQAKLANILFAQELARRLEAKSVGNVYVNAAHPGLVATRFAYNFLHNRGWSEESSQRAENVVEAVWIRLGLFFDTEGGSLTQLYLATSPEVEAKGIRGKFYIPVAHEGVFDPHVAAHSANKTLAKALWTLSDELTERWARN